MNHKMDNKSKMHISNKSREKIKRVFSADWEFPNQTRSEFSSKEFSRDALKLEKHTSNLVRPRTLLRTMGKFIKADNIKNLSIIRSDSLRADIYTPSTKGTYDVLKPSSPVNVDLTKSRISGTNGLNFNLDKPPTRRALNFTENNDGEQRNRICNFNAVSLFKEYPSTSEIKSCQNSPHNASISNTGISSLENIGIGVDERPNNVTGSMEIECCYSDSRQCKFEGNVLKNPSVLQADSTSMKRQNCKTASINGRAAINELQAFVDYSNVDRLVSLKSVKKKAKTKSSIQPRPGFDFPSDCSVEKDLSNGQRSDITSQTTFTDNKLADSSMTMKHLIAAAQAKRRQAHSHELLDENSFLKNKKWFQTSVPSEPVDSDRVLLVKQGEHDDYDHIPNTENRQCTDSMSSSTELVVARGALEGMIETLSRTRDSIGRATRQAISCAKYGMANEVVELLIERLENESCLSRRIDLFFLVDSITQCSHSHKGMAGASYVPIVQSALTRLLDASAPCGTPSHENRRQCLKVLRLWLERGIMPEKFLRRHMNDLKVRNNGLKSGFSRRIQSCGQLSEDGTMREIESLPFNQYGSNTAFLFPGVLSANQFDSEVLPNSPFNATTDNSSSENHSMKTHLHTLNHLENEIEMEDALSVSPDPKSTVGSLSCEPHQNELLFVPDCFPPLPLDPPPTPPPLPLSPPPPTPPPLSTPPPLPPPLSFLPTTLISQSSGQLPSSNCPSRCSPSLRPENVDQSIHPNGYIVFKDPTPGVKNEVPQTINLTQVSHSSYLLRRCNEAAQQMMPSQSTPPALKFLNHSLSNSQMSSDHLSHGKSMRLRQLLRKYGSHTSIIPLQRKSCVKKQWTPHYNNGHLNYSDARNIKIRTPSCSIAPFIQDGYCRLKIERPPTIDFQHLRFPAPALSLPGNIFPKWHSPDISRPT